MAFQDIEQGSIKNDQEEDIDDERHGHPPIRAVTPGGHVEDRSQDPLPLEHRKFANPAPLGLTSFGCGFFIASAFNLHARGVTIPNVVFPVLILYGGLCQFMCGMWEMATGNTFGATVFGSFGCFNFTYGCIYMPAFGVIREICRLPTVELMWFIELMRAAYNSEAYTLEDGTLSPQFDQAIGIYLMAWTVVSVLFSIGALRTNVVVLATLVLTAIAFLFLSLASMTASDGCRIAGGAFGMAASFSAWYGAMSGFYSPTATYERIRLPTYALQ